MKAVLSLSKRLLLFILCCVPVLAGAQSTKVIGSLTSSNSYLYGPYYRSSSGSSYDYSRYAYVYTSSELGIPPGSTIIGVAWRKANSGIITGNNVFDIYMENTSATSYPSSQAWTSVISGATQVYSSNTQQFLATTNTWESFSITPFIYTGNSLRVMTNHVMNGSATSANRFRYNTATGKAIGYARNTQAGVNTLTASSYGNRRPTIRIEYLPPTPCSGTATAGVASGPDSICANVQFPLTLTGNTAPTTVGMSYTWQSRPTSGGPWTTFYTSSTQPNTTTSLTVSTDYRCIVSCSNSNSSDTTSPITVKAKTFYTCYCNGSLGGSTASGIDSVSIPNTTLNHIAPGSASPYYTQAPYGGNTTAQLNIGAMHKIYVKFSSNSVGAAWLDANRNGTFENSEYVDLNSTGIYGMAYISVPVTAQPGLTGLRVRSAAANATLTASKDCSNIGSGETIDYVVELVPGPANDLQALYLQSPGDGMSICANPPTPVSLEIYNSGSSAQSNFTVYAFYDGPGSVNGVLTYNYTGTLQPYTKDTVSFGNFNPIAAGVYTFGGITTLAGDVNATNDSAYTIEIEVYPIPTQPVLYSDTVCPGGTPVLNAVPDTPNFQHKWYDAQTGGNLVFTGETLSLPGITADTTFYVSKASKSVSGSIFTTNAAGNGCGGGAMFDITPNVNLELDSFLVKTNTASSQTVRVYYKVGTHIGSQTNSGAWTLVGSTTISGPNGSVQLVDVGASIPLSAGVTYGIYINYNADYTNGSLTYSNADMSLKTGTGLCSQFGGTNNGRMFNGTVFYHYGTGCETDRVPVTAAVRPAPVVDLGPDTSICENIAYVLDAGNQGASYIWSTGDNTRTISAPFQNGQYWVEVDRYCKVFDTVTLDIKPLPSANGISYVRDGFKYSFQPAGDINALSYMWLFGDGTSDTGRVTEHTYANGNPYNVRLVMTNNCGNDTVSLLIPTGINQVTGAERDVVLYPNPAQSDITIELKGKTRMNRLVVYNSVGMKVKEILVDNTTKHSLNISQLSAGQYIIQIYTDDELIKRPFTIIH